MIVQLFFNGKVLSQNVDPVIISPLDIYDVSDLASEE